MTTYTRQDAVQVLAEMVTPLATELLATDFGDQVKAKRFRVLMSLISELSGLDEGTVGPMVRATRPKNRPTHTSEQRVNKEILAAGCTALMKLLPAHERLCLKDASKEIVKSVLKKCSPLPNWLRKVDDETIRGWRRDFSGSLFVEALTKRFVEQANGSRKVVIFATAETFTRSLDGTSLISVATKLSSFVSRPAP